MAAALAQDTQAESISVVTGFSWSALPRVLTAASWRGHLLNALHVLPQAFLVPSVHVYWAFPTCQTWGHTTVGRTRQCPCSLPAVSRAPLQATVYWPPRESGLDYEHSSLLLETLREHRVSLKMTSLLPSMHQGPRRSDFHLPLASASLGWSVCHQGPSWVP